jgi:excinuclease ABC subunit A
MGPEGGGGGGTIVATGTPEEIAGVPESHTGTFLRRLVGQPDPAPRPARAGGAAAARPAATAKRAPAKRAPAKRTAARSR